MAEDEVLTEEETHAPNAAVILNYSQTPVNYDAVPKVWLTHPDSTEEAPVLVPFTYGEAVSKTVEPDFSGGDMAVPIADGELVTDLTIKKPADLVPDKIASGEYIAGVGPGTHTGGGGSGNLGELLTGDYLNQVSYQLDVENMELVVCSPCVINVTIPDSYGAFKTALNPSHFYHTKYSVESLNIGSNVKFIGNSAANVFRNFVNLNSPINIPDPVTNMNNAFHNCRKLNSPVRLPNNATRMFYTFANCVNFNQPVTIPNNVTHAMRAFYGCTNFNSPVTFGENTRNTYEMFSNCQKFNQPVEMPQNPDMSYMFYNCRNFNQPITIRHNGILYASNAFANCVKFDQPVTIECGTGAFLSRMFYNCPNMASNIYLQGNAVNNVGYMLYGHSTSKRINIHVPAGGAINSHIYNSAAVAANSILGAVFTWTVAEDHYYNTARNIYVYPV